MKLSEFVYGLGAFWQFALQLWLIDLLMFPTSDRSDTDDFLLLLVGDLRRLTNYKGIMWFDTN